MPFQSEKQRRYLWANEPEIARDWTDTYGSRIHKYDGGIARIGLKMGGNPWSWLGSKLLEILLNQGDDDENTWFQTQAQNITGGIGNLRDRLRTVHGTIQPQSYWSPQSRLQRQNKARTSWMLDRALSGQNYSDTNLQNLGGIKVSPITTGGGEGPDVTISHGGRDYSAYSNTPAGRSRAASIEGSFNRGGLAALWQS